MSREIIPSTKFIKDARKIKKKGIDFAEVAKVIDALASGTTLPARCRPHKLEGASFSECHIAPDLLLVYQIDVEQNILYLARLGSHSDLF